jgi:predicted transposase YdaD
MVKLQEMAMSDWITGVNTAIEKITLKLLKKSLKKGLPIETIHEITGLDIETIQSLE